VPYATTYTTCLPPVTGSVVSVGLKRHLYGTPADRECAQD